MHLFSRVCKNKQTNQRVDRKPFTMEVFVAIEHLPPRLHLQPRNCQHIILLVFFSKLRDSLKNWLIELNSNITLSIHKESIQTKVMGRIGSKWGSK